METIMPFVCLAVQSSGFFAMHGSVNSPAMTIKHRSRAEWQLCGGAAQHCPSELRHPLMSCCYNPTAFSHKWTLQRILPPPLFLSLSPADGLGPDQPLHPEAAPVHWPDGVLPGGDQGGRPLWVPAGEHPFPGGLSQTFPQCPLLLLGQLVL